MDAVAPALQCDKAAAKLSCRLEDKVVRPRSNTLLGEDSGFVAGVYLLLAVKLLPVGVIVVEQGFVQSTLGAFQDNDFVDFAAQVVAGGEPPHEA